MRAPFAAAVLTLSVVSAQAETAACVSFSDIASDMQERFPEAYLHSGPIEGEDATYYVFAAEGRPTMLVFGFVDGCFEGYFEISNSKLFGSVS